MRNPVRRSRNIGTAKQGHGRSNRLVIPRVANSERSWTSSLHPHMLIQRVVGGREVLFIVEETTNDCVHACSVDDIAHVLAALPLEDWEGLSTFVLRQSTRKQRIMAPAWGRLLYFADLTQPGQATVRSGPAVLIEAVQPGERFKWRTSLDPDDLAELERLRSDGHIVEREGSRFVFTVTADAARATQLYRTLIHEIGHWVDWLEKVRRPRLAGADFDDVRDAYFQRPNAEREAFAHRYADQAGERLRRFGIIPFERRELRTGASAEERAR